MSRPAYYTEIDERLIKIEERQTESRDTVDNMLVNQASQIKRMDEIHFLLAGTEYEKENNGGLVGEVIRIKHKVHRNTAWRIKITAAVSAAGAVISFILFKFGTIITTIRDIINAE